MQLPASSRVLGMGGSAPPHASVQRDRGSESQGISEYDLKSNLFQAIPETIGDPKGPKIEKIQFRLKISIPIENFNL